MKAVIKFIFIFRDGFPADRVGNLYRKQHAILFISDLQTIFDGGGMQSTF